jgi:hypothetical protein
MKTQNYQQCWPAREKAQSEVYATGGKVLLYIFVYAFVFPFEHRFSITRQMTNTCPEMYDFAV